MNASASDLSSQVLQARRGVGYWRAGGFALIEAKGPDAERYLHNMLTADIKRLKVGEGVFALKTSSRGMPEALFRVYRIADATYWLLVEAAQLDGAIEHLEKLHITEDFELTSLKDSHGLIAIQGKNASQLVGALCTEKLSLQSLADHGNVAADIDGRATRLVAESLTGDRGYLCVVEQAAVDDLYSKLVQAAEKLGGVELDDAAQEAMRIEAGIPRFGIDVFPNAVASELGIEHEALSYDKGCFVGQEIIARIRTKGEVPFRLMGLSFEAGASLPSVGSKLDTDDGTKGAAIVTSAALSPTLGRPIAIARVKRGYQIQGVKLSFDEAGTKHQAQVVELPLYVPGPTTSELYDQAMDLFAHDKEEEALALLEKELESNPNNIDALEALGVIHDRGGRHAEAVKFMNRIVEHDPKHLMAHVNLSLYHMKLGDKATAEDFQAKATRISMERRMAEAKAQGKTLSGEDEAQRIAKIEARLEKFKAIMEMDPDDVLGHFGAGKACLDLKRFGEAVSHLERVLEIQEDYSVAWANLGTAYASLGEIEKARVTFEKGIKVATEKGDLMPKRDMEHRLARLNEGS